MNCGQWEDKIALYVGGDLAPADAAAVERHLRDCPGCQLFASGLKESLAWLQEMDREPIAPAHFAAVRARVLGELNGVRQPWWRQGWAYGVAAGVVVLALILVPHPKPTVAKKPAVSELKMPPVVPTAPAPAIAKVHHNRRRKIRPPAMPAEPGPPLVVKLVTDDPDIVIYWITDKSGE